MNIKEDFIPEGKNNRPGFSMQPKYITIHDTGNTNHGADAAMHAQYIKGDSAASIPVSWHFTVDETDIYQHLPLNEPGWHAGDGRNGTGNRESIGIENCMHADADRERIERLSAKLCAYLIKNIDTLKSFPECMKQHYDWSGKDCPPAIRRGEANTWEQYLELVEGELKVGRDEELHWKQEQAIKMIESLGEKGLLNDPEQHIERVKNNEPLGDFVWLTLLERLARKL